MHMMNALSCSLTLAPLQATREAVMAAVSRANHEQPGTLAGVAGMPTVRRVRARPRVRARAVLKVRVRVSSGLGLGSGLGL